MSAAVPTDEIYERYLQKAIGEINELQHELLALADETHVPVLGSGHPLGDVFLLKHTPQQAEITEGVAFFGRSGNALLKSLQRLGVDPLTIYGTNCLKFGTEEAEQAAPWLTRELHIVQPKLAGRDGGRGGTVPRRAGVPARRPARGCRARGRTTLHADDRGARDAGYRLRARRAGREDSVLERLQGAGAVVGAAAPVLTRRRSAALAAPSSPRSSPGMPGPACCPSSLAGRTSSLSRSSCCRSPSPCRGSRSRSRDAPRASGRRGSGGARSRARPAGTASLFNVAKLVASDARSASSSCSSSRRSRGSSSSPSSSRGSTRSRCGAGRPTTSCPSSRACSSGSRSRSGCRARRDRRTSARPTSSSSRSSSPRQTGSG